MSLLVGVMGIVPPLIQDSDLDAAGIVTIASGVASCVLAGVQLYLSGTPTIGVVASTGM